MLPSARDSLIRYVTPEKLRSMLGQEELRWSPWFIGLTNPRNPAQKNAV